MLYFEACVLCTPSRVVSACQPEIGNKKYRTWNALVKMTCEYLDRVFFELVKNNLYKGQKDGKRLDSVAE